MCKATKQLESVCDAGPYLRAGFTISMHLNIYMGIKVDLGRILGLIKSLIKSKKARDLIEGPVAEKQIAGPIEILKTTPIGCVELKGVLQVLNDQFHDGCCQGEGGGHGANGTAGYSEYGGGYDDYGGAAANNT